MALKRTLSIMLLLVSGCTTQWVSPKQTGDVSFEKWSDEVPAYRFGAGDKIKVEFLLTPEVGEDAMVGPDGFIGLRVAGRVRAQGLTAEQLQDAIAEHAAKNLQHPIVTVSLTQAGAAQVVVGGQVAKPGVFPLVGRDSPMEAIMLAGGFLPEARMSEVVIIRRNADNHAMLRTVDLQDFVNTGNPNDQLPLQPGDVVFVPRTKVAEVDLWVDQVLNKMVPFSKSLNYDVTPNINH